MEGQDLTDLRRMRAKQSAELPTKSNVLHDDWCWDSCEQAEWDVFPTGNITQLWIGQQQAVQSRMVSAAEVHSYLEKWEIILYALHWCDHSVPPGPCF